jgi:hypothetical protein
MIRDMIKNMTLLEATVVGIIVLFLLSISYLAYAESKQWQKFSAEHNCKIISYDAGSTNIGFGTGIMTNGKFGTGTIVVTESSKTGYLCDDGIIYWR